VNSKRTEPTLNALTVDVEDYFQVSAFENRVSRADWERIPSRVVANTRRLLDLFARHQVHGTFFILGWVARRFPNLVREISEQGHEIACHSNWHRLIYDLTPEEFLQDTREARDILQEAAGCAVTAYRAPTFSITGRSTWALDILLDLGFRVDSSIFPIHHDRYGMPGAQASPHRLARPGGALWEFPPSVARVGPWNIPVAGGGYFRLYPFHFTVRCYRRLHTLSRPVIFYIHPWEVDPEQPRIPRMPWQNWRHYVNLHTTEAKLDRLLAEFRWGKLSEVQSILERSVGADRPVLDAPHAIPAR
jgi:polysaccharide deacetylase family protein (PEP-CTERM system associated)